MKYLLDQTKAYQVLSQIDRFQDPNVDKGDSSDDFSYESDSSLDIFCDKVKVSDNSNMTNYGSYFTEVNVCVLCVFLLKENKPKIDKNERHAESPFLEI